MFFLMISEFMPGCKPPDAQLDVTEDEALMRLACIIKRKVAQSSRSHLKLACALARESVAWDTPLVSASLRPKLSGSPVDV